MVKNQRESLSAIESILLYNQFSQRIRIILYQIGLN